MVEEVLLWENMPNSLKYMLVSMTTMFLLSASLLVQATEKGLFWRMESPSGHVSYLFGTMHTDDNRVTDFAPSVMAALKRIDLFLMETAPNNDQSHYLMQDNNLKTVLTETELDQVRVLADFHVMHLDHVLKMKPWLLAIVFSQSKPQTPFSQDNLLMRSAEGFNKRAKGLETSQEHFSGIDGFTLDEQLMMLRAALKMTAAQKEQDFEKLIAVYLSGDSDKILDLDAEITSATLPKILWQKLRVKLLDERNVLMAQRAIEQAKDQTVFIAVGAAHLAGDTTGLINQFKQAGYKLTRVKK